MMGTFKMTPLEIGNLIPEELYNKVNECWQSALIVGVDEIQLRRRPRSPARK